ncbi:MAG: hypothetical protein ACKPB4_23035 [Sphaerospermopsis kisseleviana]
MHTLKSITIPVPAKAERKLNELFMHEKRFIEFAKALRLECDQGYLETYERSKVLFPHARLVRPRRLELRAHLAHLDMLSNDERRYLSLRQSKPFKPFIEFEDANNYSDIEVITKSGHPISRSLRGEFAPGVIRRPQETSFQAWKTWRFEAPGGFSLNRAENFYGWWQVLELYELEFINLQIEDPAWRTESIEAIKRFLKGGKWRFLCQSIINPPRPIDFDPFRAPLNDIWPGAWSPWLPWIERAADFNCLSYISLQYYFSLVDQHEGSDCEWHVHLQRRQDAAKILTEGTCTEEWVRLLRALCRFEEHLAKEERLLLRLVVHNIIHMIADLLHVAFNMDTRELAVEHDGVARQGYETGLHDVNGETVRPWHLLRILDEGFFITDTIVERFVKYHFEQLQNRLDAKLDLDCASSFISSLSTVYNEPILLALASYEHARSQEQVGAWKNRKLWAAIRALVVASESETRSWFGKDSLHGVFDQLFPTEWNEQWKKFVKKHPVAEKGKLDSTEKFIDVLEELLAEVDKNIAMPVQRLDWQFTITYFARNWNAHNGHNPHPYSARLGSLVVTSVMRVLLISWEVARGEMKYKQNLNAMYPVFADR